MQSTMRNAICAVIFTSLVLVHWAKADVNISAAGFGEVIKAIQDWIHYQPSPAESRSTVTKLATQLAILAGMNTSLADAMQADGPANTVWMYRQLQIIREKNQEMVQLIENADPGFGVQNNKLMSDLSNRINEKVRLLDPGGNTVDLSQETVRKQFGGVLRKEAQILLDLSNQISAALTK
jgi:hypothetical protein